MLGCIVDSCQYYHQKGLRRFSFRTFIIFKLPSSDWLTSCGCKHLQGFAVTLSVPVKAFSDATICV